MPAAIRVRVGASLDRSIDVVFASIERRARRTSQVVERSLRAGSGRGGPYRAIATEAETSYRRVSRAADRSAREAERAQLRAARNIERGFRQIANVAARELARSNRAAQREAERAGQAFARRTSHRATRFLTPNAPIASMAANAGRDMLRGAGIDFSLGTAMQRSMGMQRLATQISNAGFMRGGAGPAGARQDPRALISEARAAGDASAMAPEQALEGLSAFVGKTGDLATGRALLADMARLSQATGANMNDMIDAAGDVSAAMGEAAESEGEAQDRARRVAEIMRVIAGQGKLGAVEVKDLASQMAKVSTTATAFTGDRSKNIATMGALAQMARSRGGAASANIAATSVAAFVNTLRTPARMSAFKEAGVEIEAGGGKFRDPQEIIIDAIKAAGTDTAKFKNLFANVQGARAVEGFRQTYLEAGGGAAGEAAVRGKFRELGAGAAITADEEQESLRRALETDAAKAQKFQNELDKVMSTLAGKVIPAFEKHSDKILDLAGKMGDLATWVVDNPKKAIALAISASIARAGLESVLRAGIERAILGPGGGTTAAGGAAGGRGGKIAAAAGVAGAGLTIAATAITIAQVGMLTIDAIDNVVQKKQGEDVMKDVRSHVALENAKARGFLTSQEASELEGQLTAERRRLARVKSHGEGAVGMLARGMGFVPRAFGEFMGGKSLGAITGEVADIGNKGEIEDRIRGLERIMSDIKGGTLQVRVVNPEDIKDSGPSADKNRGGPPPLLTP